MLDAWFRGEEEELIVIKMNLGQGMDGMSVRGYE
jgi:hypothetical protein